MAKRLRRIAVSVIVGLAALGPACSGSLALGIVHLPQILPTPHTSPPPPNLLGPPGGSLGPLSSCSRFPFGRRSVGHIKRWRVRVGRVVNSFRANMFGISVGAEIQHESCATLTKDLDTDVRTHARWLRMDINWAVIQNDGPSRYDWSRSDRLLREARRRGLHVLGVIDYTPWWARPKGTWVTYGPNPSAFAAFARVAARHYGRLGIHHYEIWNEPNTSSYWLPEPDPAAYTALLKASYLAIKQVQPSATVLTGGTAPAITTTGSYSPVDFLKGIYASGGRGYFNAVGHHPYSWPVFPGAADPQSAWYQMYGTSPSLRSVMIDKGDGAKKIWATEFGAPTSGPPGTHVSAHDQARMVIRAYKLFAGYRWAGPLFFYQGRDLGTNPATYQNFFGLSRHDFSRKPAYAAYMSANRAVLRSLKRRR